MKAHYDQLANSAGFEEDDSVWLYPLSERMENHPKLTSFLPSRDRSVLNVVLKPSAVRGNKHKPLPLNLG
jgi:hypothetical protein